MDENTVLDRIRKLLTLAERSDSSHERQTALAAAHRLMERYNITLAEAGAHEVERFETYDEQVWSGRRVRWHQQAVCAVLNKCFLVQAYVSTGDEQSVHLFGERHNVEIARYVFVFLCREFRKRWRAHCRRVGHARGEAGYFEGMAHEVVRRLSDSRREVSAGGHLIRTADRLEREWRRSHPDAESRDLVARDDTQFLDGVRDGRDIEVRKPLRGQQQAASRTISITDSITEEQTMLVLSRKANERLLIGEDVVITLVEIRRDNVRIGIDAPRDVMILREEVAAHVRRQEADRDG